MEENKPLWKPRHQLVSESMVKHAQFLGWKEVQYLKTVDRAAAVPMGYFGNVWVRLNYFPNSGDANEGHRHKFDHVSFLTQGKVSVQVEGSEEALVYTAPFWIKIPKELAHKIVALEKDTIWWCVYAIRDEDGKVLEEDFNPEVHPAKFRANGELVEPFGSERIMLPHELPVK